MQFRIVLVALTLAAVALLVAACGGNSKSPGVANLGTSAVGTNRSHASSGPPASFGAAPGGGGSHAQMVMKVPVAEGQKYAACMRSHGVPNFPDPNSQGEISISGIDPGSPKFQSAQNACQKVLPNGGKPTPQQIATMERTALAFTACMRSHGVHDFPDPSFRGGGFSIHIGGSPGSDLNPNNPTFQAAQQACRGRLPFGAKR